MPEPLPATEPNRTSLRPHKATADDFPVREYVAAMAGELAQMARWDGDERLAYALDIAAELAARPPGPRNGPEKQQG